VLSASSPAASSSAGVKAPSGVLSASMMYTNTTEACPNNWINPLDVPSGVGWVISAAYCMPMGEALTRKKPRAKAEANSSQALVAKVSPSRPGTASTKPSRMKRLRRCWRSEMGGMSTAPITPPTSINAPRVPASAGVKPRGRTMFSTQVVTPLKMPIPMKDTTRYSQKSRTLRACLSPSSISARTSWPSGQGGVAGFSRAKTRNSSAETAAMAPYSNCTLGMLMLSIRAGVSTMPRAVPTRLDSVTMPTAVARSSMLNHCAGTLVHALSRKGCDTARPMVASSTRV